MYVGTPVVRDLGRYERTGIAFVDVGMVHGMVEKVVGVVYYDRDYGVRHVVYPLSDDYGIRHRYVDDVLGAERASFEHEVPGPVLHDVMFDSAVLHEHGADRNFGTENA